eukprot:6457572-Prymnesium_polylepis.3
MRCCSAVAEFVTAYTLPAARTGTTLGNPRRLYDALSRQLHAPRRRDDRLGSASKLFGPRKRVTLLRAKPCVHHGWTRRREIRRAVKPTLNAQMHAVL